LFTERRYFTTIIPTNAIATAERVERQNTLAVPDEISENKKGKLSIYNPTDGVSELEMLKMAFKIPKTMMRNAFICVPVLERSEATQNPLPSVISGGFCGYRGVHTANQRSQQRCQNALHKKHM
jgi:hypothetical protein